MVAETGLPQMIDNYEQWDQRSQVYDRFKFRRVLAVPLKIPKPPSLGVINADDNQGTMSFSEADIRLLCLFADQAAVAVEKARLYGELQRDLEETQAR